MNEWLAMVKAEHKTLVEQFRTLKAELEDRNQLLLGNTENLLECIAARKENRKPVYTDQPRTDLRRD